MNEWSQVVFLLDCDFLLGLNTISYGIRRTAGEIFRSRAFVSDRSFNKTTQQYRQMSML